SGWFMAQVTYQTGQGTVKITLERKDDGSVMATVGEHSYALTATPAAHGAWLLEHEGRRIEVFTASDGMRRFAQVAGGPVYALSIVEPSTRRRSGAAASEGKLTAQMPGQVIDVLVQAGDSVT